MKLLFLILVLSFTSLTSATQVNALTRDEWIRSARIGSGTTTAVNIVTNIIHLGGSQIVGNNASNSTSLATIQDAVNRINLLRASLRLR